MTDKPEFVEYKGIKVFSVLGCQATIVGTPDGKRHFEYECPDKVTRDQLAKVLEEESILRVKTVVKEVTPEVTPESE